MNNVLPECRAGSSSMPQLIKKRGKRCHGCKTVEKDRRHCSGEPVCHKCLRRIGKKSTDDSLCEHQLLTWPDWYAACRSLGDDFRINFQRNLGLPFDEPVTSFESVVLEICFKDKENQFVVEDLEKKKSKKRKNPVRKTCETKPDTKKATAGFTDEFSRVVLDWQSTDRGFSVQQEHGGDGTLRPPLINHEQLNKFVREEVWGSLYQNATAQALPQRELELMDKTLLFTGYIVLLTNLKTTMIHQISVSDICTPAFVACEFVYSLAFYAQLLFTEVHILSKGLIEENIRVRSSKYVLKVMGMMSSVLIWSTKQNWGDAASGNKIHQLLALLKARMEFVAETILVDECRGSNFLADCPGKCPRIFDFAKRLVSDDTIGFPQHCAIIIRMHNQHCRSGYNFVPSNGFDNMGKSVLDLLSPMADDILPGLLFSSGPPSNDVPYTLVTKDHKRVLPKDIVRAKLNQSKSTQSLSNTMDICGSPIPSTEDGDEIFVPNDVVHHPSNVHEEVGSNLPLQTPGLTHGNTDSEVDMDLRTISSDDEEP